MQMLKGINLVKVKGCSLIDRGPQESFKFPIQGSQVRVEISLA
jgi:hypothetical protein